MILPGISYLYCGTISWSGYNCSGIQLGCAPTEKQAGCKRNLISYFTSPASEIGAFFGVLFATSVRLVHHSVPFVVDGSFAV